MQTLRERKGPQVPCSYSLEVGWVLKPNKKCKYKHTANLRSRYAQEKKLQHLQRLERDSLVIGTPRHVGTVIATDAKVEGKGIINVSRAAQE